MRLSNAVALLVLAGPGVAAAQVPKAQCADSLRNRLVLVTPLGCFLADGSEPDTVVPRPVATAREGDPLSADLFPPELIMAHQRELDLQDSQRAAIMSEIQKAQASFVALQWKMSAEAERLDSLLKPYNPDEGAVLQQVDRTLAVEREIKRAQVTLLVRIKNTLTPAQQAKLSVWRNANPTKQVQIRGL